MAPPAARREDRSRNSSSRVSTGRVLRPRPAQSTRYAPGSSSNRSAPPTPPRLPRPPNRSTRASAAPAVTRRSTLTAAASTNASPGTARSAVNIVNRSSRRGTGVMPQAEPPSLNPPPIPTDDQNAQVQGDGRIKYVLFSRERLEGRLRPENRTVVYPFQFTAELYCVQWTPRHPFQVVMVLPDGDESPTITNFRGNGSELKGKLSNIVAALQLQCKDTTYHEGTYGSPLGPLESNLYPKILIAAPFKYVLIHSDYIAIYDHTVSPPWRIVAVAPGYDQWKYYDVTLEQRAITAEVVGTSRGIMVTSLQLVSKNEAGKGKKKQPNATDGNVTILTNHSQHMGPDTMKRLTVCAVTGTLLTETERGTYRYSFNPQNPAEDCWEMFSDGSGRPVPNAVPPRYAGHRLVLKLDPEADPYVHEDDADVQMSNQPNPLLLTARGIVNPAAQPRGPVANIARPSGISIGAPVDQRQPQGNAAAANQTGTGVRALPGTGGQRAAGASSMLGAGGEPPGPSGRSNAGSGRDQAGGTNRNRMSADQGRVASRLSQSSRHHQ